MTTLIKAAKETSDSADPDDSSVEGDSADPKDSSVEGDSPDPDCFSVVGGSTDPESSLVVGDSEVSSVAGDSEVSTVAGESVGSLSPSAASSTVTEQRTKWKTTVIKIPIKLPVTSEYVFPI